MEKQPFDEAGLQSLLHELYALNDLDLTEQATALKHQPKLWINGHFELNSDQLQFLDQLPAAVATFLGDQGSFAIANRLPIHLIKNYRSNDPHKGDDQGKLFKPTSSLAIQTDAQGNVLSSGALEINVSYSEQT